jgi:pimeloyl-ACP methyl ester carboxylesterase
VGSLALLYVAQGIPFGFATEYLPVVLREDGYSYSAIAALSWLQLPWQLKVLWAKAADRPGARARTRTLVLALQMALTAAVAAFAIHPLKEAPDLWFSLVFVTAALAATQDVFVDALAVRELGDVSPAEELSRAMDVTGLVRAHLVGSSFGAAVAVDFALANPRRVSSLTLVGPELLGRRSGIEAWDRCVELASEGDRGTACEVWLDDALYEGVRADEELFEELRQIVLDYGGGHWTGRVGSTWAEPDPVPRLKKLEIPSLVVSGEADLPSFMLMAEAYAKAIPGARREIVQGAGHLVNLERADAFNAVLRDFLKSV